MRRHHILFLAAITCAMGCYNNKKEVETAKHSLYDADFTIVYKAALEAAREAYPTNIEAARDRGTIRTPWNQVHAQGDPNKRYFIRFDIIVADGRPWRIEAVGHAAEWERGAALPNELQGAARPPWLEQRTDALLYTIHQKIEAYAVPNKEAVAAPTR